MTRRRKRDHREGSELEPLVMVGADAREGCRDGQPLFGDDLARDAYSYQSAREPRSKLYYDEWT